MESAICRKYCSFYKPGKNEPSKCGTVEFLRRNLTEREVRQAVSQAPPQYDLSSDETIKRLICRNCEFLVDGCDFRDGVESPPCGGYFVVEHLLKG